MFLLLSENNLCNYYTLDKNAGIKAKGKFASERFAYLDDEFIINKLLQFSSDKQANVVFQLPQIHCTSCIFLLESLHRINEGIITSQSNFQKKEVFIVYNPQIISLRKVVELLSFIGYEPVITLADAQKKEPVTFDRKQIYKIGIAGFCFLNIMMLSFPEYLSGGNIDIGLKQTFTWLNFALSLPVLILSASGIFTSAWKGIRQNFLNIDAPIALAIVVTFARSYYEIIGGHGAGYLDSGTGRWFQNKTYDTFKFDRDYTSYFPLGVTVIQGGIEKNISVSRLKKGDHIILRNEEMIPADAILLKGHAIIDYSFVSGENTAVEKRTGDLIYSGGKQLGGSIEAEIIKEASQSYITQLWNNDIFNNKKNDEKSFIHPWSRYFTLGLFIVAFGTILFWWYYDTSKILPAFTAVLIVACPCSLLLSATFTYGNMLRIFGKNKLYLKNANVIEALAKINTIIFDKTGTLTQNKSSIVSYEGTPLTTKELFAVKSMASQSSHPLSKMIVRSLSKIPGHEEITKFKEYAGKGVEATINNIDVRLGSAKFIDQFNNKPTRQDAGTHVHVALNNVYMGRFTINNKYREGMRELAESLIKEKFELGILSGDNNSEEEKLHKIFSQNIELRFNQSPQQKLDFIKISREQKKNVLMMGDGLNDAGALMQSDVGIAVSDNTSQFSPACDAILDRSNIRLLDKFIAFAKSGRSIITASFVLSILYNIIGLFFAVQGILSPIVAAILMPASSISIVMLVTTLSSLSARRKNLRC